MACVRIFNIVQTEYFQYVKELLHNSANRKQVFSIFLRALKHQKTVAPFKACVTSCAFVLVSRIRAELIRTYHDGKQKNLSNFGRPCAVDVSKCKDYFCNFKTFVNFC